ncbi:hypothetical protein BMR1_02g01415 [Babesia microti strain RI]|uniref:Uncharacterized protein n=1 Tax=Babesia microti (strain RI) TaxID=1133968 RepID=I7J9R6_BABMR|nr:hypothetical protein BMR1_02g01415 [Babesia microti strain RI]CCF73444.1 hypothetical protein BMR1_02g01415 [Babesia microti strain RI]|eukprot:XP_012648053.1 hypothetical protein BMR1_02g01415 [Babesia microti strain RI]
MVVQNQILLDEDTPISLDAYKEDTICIHNVTVYADYGICLNLNEVSSKFGNCLYLPKEFNCVRIDVRINKHFDQAEFPLDNTEIQNRNSMSNSPNFPSTSDVSSQFQSNLVTTSIFRKSKIHKNSLQNPDNDNNHDCCKTSIKVAIFGNGKVVTTGARSVMAAACGIEKVARALRQRVSKEAKVCFMIVTNILSVYNTGYPLRLNLFAKLCPGAIYEPDRFPAAQIKIPTKRPLYLFTAASIFGKKISNFDDSQQQKMDDNQESKDSLQDFLPQSVPMITSTASKIDNKVVGNAVKVQKTSTGFEKRLTAYRYSGKVSLKNIGYFNKLKNSPTSVNSPVIGSNVKSTKSNEPVEVTKGKSAWLSDDIYNLNEAIEVVGDGHAKGRGISKEEVVTVNVFSTGNITLTGARSISSIKYALNIIAPHLSKCK